MRMFVALVVLALGTSFATVQGVPAPVVLTKHREYGDGPIRMPGNVDEVHARFHGKAGDRVALRGVNCGVSLQTAAGVEVPPGPSQLWRLPQRATYEFVHRRCPSPEGDLYLQLAKLVVHRLPVDGPEVRVEKRQGYIKAVAVRVPESGRVQVTPDRFGGSEWPDLLLPDGTRSFHGNRYRTAPDVTLEAGSPPMWQGAPLYGLDDHPLHAHDRVIFIVRKTTTLVASTAVRRDVTVDGPAVTVTNESRSYQETELAFVGAAGQWVHVEQDGALTGTGDRFRYPWLIGPDGEVLPRAWDAAYPFWQLPVTGRYRLLVETGAAPMSAQVRVRSVRVVGAMPIDGSPLTFTAASTGEWMLATVYPSSGDERRLQAVGSDSAAAWAAFAEWTPRYLCSFDDHPGCPVDARVQVDAGHPVSGCCVAHLYGSEPWSLVVAMPPGGVGSVTLSLPPDVRPPN